MSSQINFEFEAREPRIVSYLQVVKDLISRFDSFKITHIPQAANLKVDKLVRIGSGDRDPTYLVENLQYSSINGSSVNTIDETETWMTLKSGELPPDKVKARTLKKKSRPLHLQVREVVQKGVFYPTLEMYYLRTGFLCHVGNSWRCMQKSFRTTIPTAQSPYTRILLAEHGEKSRVVCPGTWCIAMIFSDHLSTC